MLTCPPKRFPLLANALLGLLLMAAASGVLASESPEETADNGHSLLHECGAAIEQLQGDLVSDTQALAAQYCLGFVAGVTRLVAITEPLKPGGQLFCPDAEGIDSTRALLAIHSYLLAHPDRLHASRITLASAALAGEYPCPPANMTVHEQLLEHARRKHSE